MGATQDEPALWLAAIGSIQASNGATLNINININQRGPEDSLRLWDELIRLQESGKIGNVIKAAALTYYIYDYPLML